MNTERFGDGNLIPASLPDSSAFDLMHSDSSQSRSKARIESLRTVPYAAKYRSPAVKDVFERVGRVKDIAEVSRLGDYLADHITKEANDVFTIVDTVHHCMTLLNRGRSRNFASSVLNKIEEYFQEQQITHKKAFPEEIEDVDDINNEFFHLLVGLVSMPNYKLLRKDHTSIDGMIHSTSKAIAQNDLASRHRIDIGSARWGNRTSKLEALQKAYHDSWTEGVGQTKEAMDQFPLVGGIVSGHAVLNILKEFSVKHPGIGIDMYRQKYNGFSLEDVVTEDKSENFTHKLSEYLKGIPVGDSFIASWMSIMFLSFSELTPTSEHSTAIPDLALQKRIFNFQKRLTEFLVLPTIDSNFDDDEMSVLAESLMKLSCNPDFSSMLAYLVYNMTVHGYETNKSLYYQGRENSDLFPIRDLVLKKFPYLNLEAASGHAFFEAFVDDIKDFVLNRFGDSVGSKKFLKNLDRMLGKENILTAITQIKSKIWQDAFGENYISLISDRLKDNPHFTLERVEIDPEMIDSLELKDEVLRAHWYKYKDSAILDQLCFRYIKVEPNSDPRFLYHFSVLENSGFIYGLFDRSGKIAYLSLQFEPEQRPLELAIVNVITESLRGITKAEDYVASIKTLDFIPDIPVRVDFDQGVVKNDEIYAKNIDKITRKKETDGHVLTVLEANRLLLDILGLQE